jgi:SpoVK/Ycf46/Vps4 family AAA+-type ATPase
MSDDDKKLSDLTKKDLIEIGRESNRYHSRKNEYLTRHLGIKVEEIVVVTEYLSKYEQIVQLAMFDDFMKLTGLSIDLMVDIVDGNNVYPFEYRDIEVDRGKNIKVIDSGFIFMTHKDGWKVVLQCSEWSIDRYKVKLHVRLEQQAWAVDFLSQWKKYAEEHNILRGKKINPSFRHLELKNEYTWDSVILPEKTKAELRRNVDLLFGSLEVYKKNGLTFKRGLILKGEPGTGKTLIGKILCNTLKDVTFIWVTPGHLTESDNVKIVCDMARHLAPAVLFLEDVDLYGAHRERENRSILGELMNQLDGLIENEFVVVVATTNRAEELEEALRNRPGRFDRVVDVPKPDADCRKKMFTLYTEKLNVAVKDRGRFMDVLVEKTEGYTGAHVKELVNSAIISAIDNKSLDANDMVVLKPSHFLQNVPRVKAKKISPVGFAETKEKARPRFTDDDDDDIDWRQIDEEYDSQQGRPSTNG